MSLVRLTAAFLAATTTLAFPAYTTPTRPGGVGFEVVHDKLDEATGLFEFKSRSDAMPLKPGEVVFTGKREERWLCPDVFH